MDIILPLNGNRQAHDLILHQDPICPKWPAVVEKVLPLLLGICLLLQTLQSQLLPLLLGQELGLHRETFFGRVPLLMYNVLSTVGSYLGEADTAPKEECAYLLHLEIAQAFVIDAPT